MGSWEALFPTVFPHMGGWEALFSPLYTLWEAGRISYHRCTLSGKLERHIPTVVHREAREAYTHRCTHRRAREAYIHTVHTQGG